MSGICLVAAGLIAAQLGNPVTLAWTHSIQKSAWEEDFRREGNALRLVEARVSGTGAGMEPPPGAVFDAGWWRYVPELPLLPRVELRHSPHAGEYHLCVSGLCRPASAWLPGLPDEAVLVLQPCDGPQ